MKIAAISVSKTKGTRKQNVPTAQLLADHGIVGDAHAGIGHRQVSLLPVEAINEFRSNGIELTPGDFAENITTLGLDYSRITIGTYLHIGPEVVLKVSQIGKTCHSGCDVGRRIGVCIMPRQGVFTQVIKGGRLNVGDEIRLQGVTVGSSLIG